MLALVEPTTPVKKNQPRESYRQWVQVTKIAVDAFTEPGGVVGWVTQLASGAPVGGAKVAFLGASAHPAERQRAPPPSTLSCRSPG